MGIKDTLKDVKNLKSKSTDKLPSASNFISMLSKFAPIVLLAFSASATAAATPLIQVTGCNVQHATPNLPSGQTMLTVPSGEIVTNIGLGVGVQNYTCASTGTFTFVLPLYFSVRRIVADILRISM